MTHLEYERTEELCRFFIEHWPAAFSLLSPDGKIVFWSPGAERMFGRAAGAVIGQPFTSVTVPPREIATAQAALLQTLAAGRAVYPAWRRRGDGSDVQVAVFMQAIPSEGRVKYVAVIQCPLRSLAPLWEAMAPPVSAPATRPGRVVPPPSVLTLRQAQVLRLLAEGLSTREVANRLHVSVKTVETHRQGGMRRLGVPNLALLVRYAVATGLVPPSP